MLTIAAKVVRGVGLGIAAVVGLGVLIYVTEANTGNVIVGAVMDVARWFADPFRFIFQLDENKAQVTFNWGIGALVYGMAGHFLAIGLESLRSRLAAREPGKTRKIGPTTHA